jgi:TP901 family phage tail tape measure protein
MSGNLDKASNSLQKMGSSLTSIGSKMTMGITAPLVGMGVAMFKTFADFENIMVELEARTGSTAEEMKKMEQFALEMGKTTAFSATEAAQALLELTSSGSSAAEAMEMLPDVLNLATAGALELGAAADGVTDILAQFQLDVAYSTKVVDSLAMAAGASSATVDDLVQAFGNVGPVAHQFGLSVNETAAAIATLSENGVKGAEAGTMLKSMLLGMTRDTIPAKSAWASLGLSMYDAAGNMRPLDDVFKDINVAMADMTMEEQNEIAQKLAGSYGIVGFNALRASNGISDMEAAMLNSATASEVADARMNTLAGRFDSLMGSLETLGIVMGGLGEGPLTSLIKMLTDVINKVTEWAQNNPRLAQMVMVILAIVAALGPLLVILGSIIGALGAISAAFAAGGIFAAGGAMAAIGTLAAPFLAIAAAVIAVGVALKMLFPYLKQLGEIIVLSFAKVGEWIVNGFKAAFDGLLSLTKAAMEGVKNIILQAADGIGSAWGKMGVGFEKQKSTWSANMSMLGEIIRLGAAKVIGFLANLHKQVAAAGGLGKVMSDVGKQMIMGLINGIGSMISALVNKVKEMASAVTNSIKGALKIKSPSKVMMGLGENVVKGFNAGIDTMGGIGVQVPALAGAGASVSSAPTARSNMGGGSGGNVYIENMTIPPGTTKEQIDFIMKEIGKRVKLRGGS